MRKADRKQIRILYVETIEIKLLDIPRALDDLGYDVYKAALNISAQGYVKQACHKVIAAIDHYSIQCAISYDFSESIAQACFETGIPYISWVYDAPQKELYTHYAFYPCNYVFVFDKMQQKRLQQIGLRNVYHIPLAILGSKIKAALKQEKNKSEPAEITFVGQLYKIDNLNAILKNAEETVRTAMEKNIEECFLCWNDDINLHGKMQDSCVRYFGELDQGKVLKNYPYMTEQFYYEAAVTSRLLANKERITVLNTLAQKYNVRFYTNDEDTSQLSEKVTVLPGVKYDDEISRIYNNSKININMTLHCIETGASQRIFDVMAAGGFMLSNYQKELKELFVVGEEIVLYHDLDELEELVEYYLSHEDERIKIAKRGQEKVLKYHDFHDKMEQVMEIVVEKEKTREKTYITLQREWMSEQANKLLAIGNEESYRKIYEIFRDLKYETTIRKTTTLGILREMIECWNMEMETGKSNIFTNVSNLEQAEYKYLSIKHGLWRIETGISEEKCWEAVYNMCQNKESKLLIAWIIRANLQDWERVFSYLAEYMREYNMSDAVEMLSYGLVFYPKNRTLLLQKADCLMELGMWSEVLKTLLLIEKPDQEIIEMITELKNVLEG